MKALSELDRNDQSDAGVLAALAKQIASISERMRPTMTGAAHGVANMSHAPSEVAGQLLRGRRQRDAILPGLFADASWDILLDLFTVHPDRVTIGNACIAAAVPATTALRAIKLLEHRGLVKRVPSADGDGRRVFLELTPDAVEKMGRVLMHYSR